MVGAANGTVRFISSVADSATRSFRVELQILIAIIKYVLELTETYPASKTDSGPCGLTGGDNARR